MVFFFLNDSYNNNAKYVFRQFTPYTKKNIPSTRGRSSEGPSAPGFACLMIVLMTPPSPVKSTASPMAHKFSKT